MKIKEEKTKCELHRGHNDCYWVEVRKREENMERSKRDEENKDERPTRKKDRGQLSKRKNSPLDALEHRARRKERQAGEALKMQVKLT
jgi:hypothetical protein